MSHHAQEFSDFGGIVRFGAFRCGRGFVADERGEQEVKRGVRAPVLAQCDIARNVEFGFDVIPGPSRDGCDVGGDLLEVL